MAGRPSPPPPPPPPAPAPAPAGPPPPKSGGLKLDIASMLGLPTAIGLILLGQRLEGGAIESLIQPTAALIVVGGTLGAVLLSFPIADVFRSVKALKNVFLWHGETPSRTIELVMHYVKLAKRDGLLALDSQLDSVSDPFLKKALRLVVDGVSVRDLRSILEVENENREAYDEIPAKVFEAAGGYAPTIGIIGAVLGLIHVMENLSDPSKLGGGIAVAFVATVYGISLANLFLLPAASKIKTKARYAARRHALMLEGVLAIKEGTNMRDVYDRLYSHAVQSVPTFDEKRKAA